MLDGAHVDLGSFVLLHAHQSAIEDVLLRQIGYRGVGLADDRHERQVEQVGFLSRRIDEHGTAQRLAAKSLIHQRAERLEKRLARMNPNTSTVLLRAHEGQAGTLPRRVGIQDLQERIGPGPVGGPQPEATARIARDLDSH